MDSASTPTPGEGESNVAPKPVTEPVLPAPVQETAPVTTPMANPLPVYPAPKKVLTPEEKKAKQKAMLKRLGVVGLMSYAAVLVFIVLWAFFGANQDLIVFDYLPITQKAFSGFLLKVFNVLIGTGLALVFLITLIHFLRSAFVKKEDVEKKKKYSRKALFGGVTFFGMALLWILGLWLLGPRLVIQEFYTSPIRTTPTETIGLTSPIEIVFDASAVPVDASTYKILSYNWDFGDGDSGTGESLSHTYKQKAPGDGIYTVTLTLTLMDLRSGQQFTDEYTKEIAIANEQTAAYFTASPESGELPLKVHFDATGSYDPDGEIVDYEWDMDDDGAFDDAIGVEADWTFEQEGNYKVTLRVTDNSGQYNTTELTVSAGSVGGLRGVISTNVGEDESYYVGQKYKFDGSLSQVDTGSITKYTWDFGDGSKAVQTRSVEHAFEKKGSYTVTLTVEDSEGNKDESTLDLTVTEEGTPPVPVVKTDPALSGGVVSGSVPLKVTFDASSSTDAEDDIVEYQWDFDGDGTMDDTGDTATYSYEEVGSYTARLTLVDSVGNTAEKEVDVEVSEQGLTARLEVSTSSGSVPLTVKFDASGSSYKSKSIVSYEYDFGDGTDPYVGEASVTYKYTKVGTYTAKVTVVGSDGVKDSTSVQIVVRPVALTACFTVNTDSGKAPLFVTVDPSCSQGTISTYQWNFGDGEISFDRKPETHTYETAGTFTITLEVTSAEGIVSDFEKTVVVK